ncbi:hypothetical protein BD410DRAFT_790017 [Rickenella mellea]|uniref:Nucleic acid-binding protein n=1 Tax=Rickenella mellea TaxID=50990 RepID=A0A4Y7Q1T1_9AGAM|nr:hypothetical protein BD410DRAFT_790017 [Rickenella mellea]
MPLLALKGVVTKCGFMNKTATVTVSKWVVHPRSKKRIERSTKYLTHDPENKLKMNDLVIIRNCPHVSARKYFVLETILHSPESVRSNGTSSAIAERPTNTSPPLLADA